MQTTAIAIQLVIASEDTGLVVDVVEIPIEDISDVRSVKATAAAIVRYATKFDPDQHEYTVHIDPEAALLSETRVVGVENGKPFRCRKERVCVPYIEARSVGLDNGGRGSYPVDLDKFLVAVIRLNLNVTPGDNPERRAFIAGYKAWVRFDSEPETDGAERDGFRAAASDNDRGGARPVATDAPEAYEEWKEEREDRKAAAEAVRKADREAARKLHAFNEPVPYGTRILQEPKPVEAFPGREERARAADLPEAKRQWVEETIQGVAGIIAEVACGQDIYLDEGEFINVIAEVEERIDPNLACGLLDAVGGGFRTGRKRVVWLNLTDYTTEWALDEAERETSEAGEDGPTPALLDRIRAAIRRTWGAIAHDILTAAGTDTLPLDEVVEVTLDADHVHSHGGDPEAAKALDLFDYEAQNDLAKAALS